MTFSKVYTAELFEQMGIEEAGAAENGVHRRIAEICGSAVYQDPRRSFSFVIKRPSQTLAGHQQFCALKISISSDSG
jgi:hypothetical protein